MVKRPRPPQLVDSASERTAIRSWSPTWRRSSRPRVSSACVRPDAATNSTSNAADVNTSTTAPKSPRRSPALGRSCVSATVSRTLNMVYLGWAVMKRGKSSAGLIIQTVRKAAERPDGPRRIPSTSKLDPCVVRLPSYAITKCMESGCRINACGERLFCHMGANRIHSKRQEPAHRATGADALPGWLSEHWPALCRPCKGSEALKCENRAVVRESVFLLCIAIR